MRFLTKSFWGTTVLLMLIFCSARGDVKINEFSALSSDRLLQWSDEGMPRLGSGIPWWELDFDDGLWPVGGAPIGFNYNQVFTD